MAEPHGLCKFGMYGEDAFMDEYVDGSWVDADAAIAMLDAKDDVIAELKAALEWYACLGVPKTRSDPLAQFDDGGKRARIALGREKP